MRNWKNWLIAAVPALALVAWVVFGLCQAGDSLPAWGLIGDAAAAPAAVLTLAALAVAWLSVRAQHASQASAEAAHEKAAKERRRHELATAYTRWMAEVYTPIAEALSVATVMRDRFQSYSTAEQRTAGATQIGAALARVRAARVLVPLAEPDARRTGEAVGLCASITSQPNRLIDGEPFRAEVATLIGNLEQRLVDLDQFADGLRTTAS